MDCLLLGSSWKEVHLRQYRTPEDTVRIGQRLGDLEVVVALGDEELYGFACRLHGRREVAGLALELRRLERAVGDDDGGVEPVEMTLRAERLLDLVGELDVGAACRETHGLQIEHATAAQPALHRVGRKIEVL